MTGVISGIIGSLKSSPLPPTVTIGATTNFTESRATFNATANGNGTNTTVVFHYSTSAGFGSYSSIYGGSGTGSIFPIAVVTGLAVNTTYYVRAVATSSGGTTTSGSTSFLTWHLITVSYGASTSLTVPTVAGVNPAALVNVLVVGGGGGGGQGLGGGGGGGYRYTTSRAFTGTSGALTITVGGGGAANANGDTTTLTGTNMTSYSAGGGTTGTAGYSGGNVGTGDNAAYTGGAGVTRGFKDVIDSSTGGGGGGINGNGTAGESSNVYYGGNGGAGGTINGWNFGAGGGGGGSPKDGTASGYIRGSVGSPSGYGTGGGGSGSESQYYGAYAATAGSSGLIVFSYYGP